MAQLPVTERTDALIKLDLADRMKKHGFRKRTRTFWRETTTRGAQPVKAIQLCEVRVGGSSTSYEGIVSPALAVFYPDFVPILAPWQKQIPAQPKEGDGQVRAPIGLVGPWKDANHSWRLDATANDEQLAREIAEAIETHGLPFLDAALDLEKVGTNAIPGVDPFLSVLALQRLGRKDAAKARVEEILAARPKEYMAIASFAGRLKLPAPPRPAK